MPRRKRSLEDLQREMKQRHPEPPPGRGRPPLEIDPEMIIALASRGLTVAEIAATVPCDPRTIRDRFIKELQMGYARFTGSLKRAGYEVAECGNARALIRMVQLRSKSWQQLCPVRDAGPTKPKKYARKFRNYTPHRGWPPPPAPEKEKQEEVKSQPWTICEFVL